MFVATKSECRKSRSLEAILYAVIFLSLPGCGNAQDRVKCGDLPPTPDPPASSVPAQTFLSTEGRFKVGLPPRAAEKPDSYDGPKEHIETTRYRWFVANHGQYQINYSDSARILENAEDSERIFDNLRDLLLSKGAGHLEADLELKLAGHPGREIRIKDGSGTNIQRFYLVGHRMYTVSVFVPSKLECALESVVKVLDSFELVEDELLKKSQEQIAEAIRFDRSVSTCMPNKRLQRIGISGPLIDNLPLAQLSPGR